jgi:hypothetical protein
MNFRPRFVWTVANGPWSRTELGTSPRREATSATAVYAASPTSTHRSVFIVTTDGSGAKRRVGSREPASVLKHTDTPPGPDGEVVATLRDDDVAPAAAPRLIVIGTVVADAIAVN